LFEETPLIVFFFISYPGPCDDCSREALTVDVPALAFDFCALPRRCPLV